MTVGVSTARLSYNGDGSTTTFVVTFYFILATDLLVVLVNNTTGAQSTKVLNTDYTVTGAGVTSGGSITFTSAPAAGYTVVIGRNVPITQQVSYQPNDPFPAKTHEGALDKLTMIAQQLNDLIGRSIVFPITDPIGLNSALPSVQSRANMFLSFDSSGQPVVVNSVTNVTAVAAISAQIVTLSANISALTSLSSNLTAINNVNSNMSAVTAAVSSASSAAASASAAASSQSSASSAATSAAASAAAAASTIAAAGLPTTLTGKAYQFLRVKATENGWDLVTSAAFPNFIGFQLNTTTGRLSYDYGRSDYDQSAYNAWDIGENVSFQVIKNQLVEVFT